MTTDVHQPKKQQQFFLQHFLQKVKSTLFGTKKRLSISILVSLGLLFIVWRIVTQSTASPQYQTAQATKETIISSVTESGNITTNSQGSVGSPTTGIIEALYVKDGDTIKQGQNLFKVKSTATAQEIASAYAAYENTLTSANTAQQGQLTAQATLEKDRAAVIAASTAVTQMQNNISVSQPNPATKQAYTQNDIDGINSALTSAQETFTADQLKYTQENQNIASSQASENAAWLAYQATQDSVVTAPITGVVANISVQVGDEVTAGSGNLSSELSNSSSSSNTGTWVLTIGNFTAPYIKVQASEVDIPTIKTGQNATILLNAFPNKTFVGQVKQVDTVGSIASGVVTYNVYVNFVAPPPGIEPGMSATVTIETAVKQDVLGVPSAAVLTANGTAAVRVLQNGKVTSIPVTTGISSDTDTQITSGLSEGQTVITGTITPSSASNGASPFGATRGFGGGFGGGGAVFFRSGGAGGGGRGG